MRAGPGLLERFRRTAGVPAAVADEPASELVPLLAVLDEIEAEAARLVGDARAAAERTLAAADAEAERVLERARARADAERARTQAERTRAAEEAARTVEAAAQVEADELRERGLARVPAAVERVLATVLESAP